MRMTAESNRALSALQRELAYEDTLSCVQCGYCLPACPTYAALGKETHSPRGRIHLVRLAAEGKMDDWSLLAEALDLCLGCRACETACPSGVRYGRILESARTAIAARRRHSAPARLARKLVFRGLFPHKRRLNSVAGTLWVYQKSGLDKAAERLRLTRLLPASLAAFAAVLPRQTSPAARARRPKTLQPRGERRFRVAFFTGCVMDAMFEQINRLSMELLALAGCEVVTVPGETCCGALHAHAGEHGDAKRLAKRNIEAFERLEASGIDYVVNNAGGCGAMLTEYPDLFEDEPQWRERARRFADKCADISVVLAQLELPFARSADHRVTVTYQPSCHMTNVQKVTVPPLQLLRSVPGVQLVKMADQDRCCGSAGIYNLIHYGASMSILDEKMRSVRATSADVVVTTNPGCLLQMRLGIQRAGLSDRMRAVHLVELLAEACGLIR